MKYSPFLSCREAARLISDDFDRDLSALERVALALHLKICGVCPKVVRQLEQLRAKVGEWRDGVEG